MQICSVDQCVLEVRNKSQEFCNMHYLRFKRHGDPLYTKKRIIRLCQITGCGEKRDAYGYCSSHYSRFKKHGDPLGGKMTFYGDPQRWMDEHISDDTNECLIWPFARLKNGYGQIRIDGRTESAHVVVATITYGPKPTPKHEVRHLCGNGHLGCVNSKHLTWGTRSENISDAIIHGTVGKLMIKDIHIIRKDTRPFKDIAHDFGVSKSCISAIKSGRNWSWLAPINDALMV